MTTNIERAARALYEHRLTVGDFPSGVAEWKDLPDPRKDEWREAAEALDDAGLLKADPCHYVLPNIDPPIHSALGVRTQADCHDLWELPPHEDDEDWVNIWTDGTRFAITHEGEPVATMDRAAARQLISALTTVLDETPEVTAEGVGTDDPA